MGERWTTEPSAEALALKNKAFKVLDHGFVMLADFMGTDATIVERARTSFAGNLRTRAKDVPLLKRLMRDKHTSPFEFCEVVFLMQLPIAIARQMIRHRTASVNEWSARYMQLPVKLYRPEKIYMQDPTNKQGRSDDVLEWAVVDDWIDVQDDCVDAYKNLNKLGAAKETSRFCLPVSTYTRWYWKIDLHNLLHFFTLRLHNHAQWETRQYAAVMAWITQQLFPITMEAFHEYRLEAKTLYSAEVSALIDVIEAHIASNPESKKVMGILDKLKAVDYTDYRNLNPTPVCEGNGSQNEERDPPLP